MFHAKLACKRLLVSYTPNNIKVIPSQEEDPDPVWGCFKRMSDNVGNNGEIMKGRNARNKRFPPQECPGMRCFGGTNRCKDSMTSLRYSRLKSCTFRSRCVVWRRTVVNLMVKGYHRISNLRSRDTEIQGSKTPDIKSSRDPKLQRFRNLKGTYPQTEDQRNLEKWPKYLHFPRLWVSWRKATLGFWMFLRIHNIFEDFSYY